MIDDQDHSNEHTDVGVVSLGDRRRIRELETQVEALSDQLAESLNHLHPGLTRKLGGQCYHRGRFEVAEHLMEVTCAHCGALMDPYVVLRKIAHREVNFCFSLTALRKEQEELDVEVRKLRVQRSSLKSQIKRKRSP